jgi:hypothetical protein
LIELVAARLITTRKSRRAEHIWAPADGTPAAITMPLPSSIAPVSDARHCCFDQLRLAHLRIMLRK